MGVLEWITWLVHSALQVAWSAWPCYLEVMFQKTNMFLLTPSHPLRGSTSFLGSAKTLLQEQLRLSPFSGREDAWRWEMPEGESQSKKSGLCHIQLRTSLQRPFSRATAFLGAVVSHVPTDGRFVNLGITSSWHDSLKHSETPFRLLRPITARRACSNLHQELQAAPRGLFHAARQPKPCFPCNKTIGANQVVCLSLRLNDCCCSERGL